MSLDREPKLSSAKALWRYIARVTVLSVACSVGATIFLISVLVGWGDDVLLPANYFHAVALFIATSVPSFVVPVLTYRRAQVIRALAIARDELHRLAHTYQLTGLLNRRGFDLEAHSLIERAREESAPLITLMADADHFKSLNDRFGHAFGDAALEHLASIMRRHANTAGAVAGRQGGDEFAILLTGQSPEAAMEIAEAILADCQSHPVTVDGQQQRLTTSLGLAIASQKTATLKDCMRMADRALLEAKRLGRDRVVCVDAQSEIVR